jgi:hypothetical protein
VTTPDPVAGKYAELRARVGEQLPPGEQFGAAIWVTRATSRPSAGEVTRRELGPRQLVESIATEGIGLDQASTGPDSYPDDRRGVLEGRPGSLAAQLDAQVPLPTAARVLALTDHRVLVLERPAPPRRGFLKGLGDIIRNQPSTEPLPPLTPRWECPRRALIAASVAGGRIHLSFGDGSTLQLVTPEVLAHQFVAAV